MAEVLVINKSYFVKKQSAIEQIFIGRFQRCSEFQKFNDNQATNVYLSLLNAKNFFDVFIPSK